MDSLEALVYLLQYRYMEQEIQQALDAQNTKLDAIYVSTEKTRKYFLTMMWISVAVVVLPALGLLIAIPAFIRTFNASFEGLL